MAGRGDWDMFIEGKLGDHYRHLGIPHLYRKVRFDWDIVVEPGYAKKSTFFANVNCVAPSSEKKEAAAKFADAMGSDRHSAAAS